MLRVESDSELIFDALILLTLYVLVRFCSLHRIPSPISLSSWMETVSEQTWNLRGCF